MKRLMIVSIVILLIQGLPFAQIIKNGSFEKGINDSWTHVVTSGQATFSQEADTVRDSSKSLRVDVTQTGSELTAISSVNSSFQRTGDTIFLLTFWAKSAVESDLYVEVNGSHSNRVHFKLRTHWVCYYLPFSSTADVAQLKFLYQTATTYYIDGVEVHDQNSGPIDVRETYRWNEKYAPGWGWIAGDNDISLPLPDGRVVWFFNDSFYGINDPTDNMFHNDGARFLRNAMVVQDQDGILHSRYAGSKDTTTRYFECIEPSPDPSVNNFYWVGDAILDSSKIYVHLIECLNKSSGAEATHRTYIAQFSYPDLVLEKITKQIPEADSYESFFIDGDYIYLYKTENSDGGWGRNTHVARCDRNDLLGDKGSWRFYNGTDWDTDTAKSVRVNTEGADGFVKLQDGNYAQISMPALSNEIRASFAQKPEGPWTTPVVVYKIPLVKNYWWYLPNLHGQLPNGKYSVCYSQNSWEGWADAWNDKYWYRQHYLQIDLLGLSPYTHGTSVAGNGSQPSQIKTAMSESMRICHRLTNSDLLITGLAGSWKSIALTDMQGRSLIVANTSAGSAHLDLTRIPNGVYMLSVRSADSRYVSKIVKR